MSAVHSLMRSDGWCSGVCVPGTWARAAGSRSSAATVWCGMAFSWMVFLCVWLGCVGEDSKMLGP